VETPACPGEHVRSWRQPGGQAVDGGQLNAIHHPANAPILAHPVLITVLPADILSPHLFIALQAPEVPVYVIGRPDIGFHGIILHWNWDTKAVHRTELFSYFGMVKWKAHCSLFTLRAIQELSKLPAVVFKSKLAFRGQAA
jgi:hypothetical protein